MKKHGILNSEISKVLSDLGHTDTIVIADCGLPIPSDVKKIDLALKLGIPSFQEVLDIIIDDMQIEEAILANEIRDVNKKQLDETMSKLTNSKIDFVSHDEFKNLTKNAKAIIRTGEATPYSNIILKSGVIF